MPKARAERPSFDFSKGINSDASPVVFPPNFTLDEENFALLPDGSRRRRLGLAVDSELVTVLSLGTDICRSFKWSNVGGNPDINFVVVQYGAHVHFYVDEHPVGSQEKTFTLDLAAYKVETASAAEVAESPIDVTFGRGHLFVVGKYLEPFYVQYDDDLDTITVLPITIQERDFEGVADSMDNTTTPTTLSDPNQYNLLNMGWKAADITAFHASKSVYPAKNMITRFGYRRTVVAGIADNDGTLAFSPDKMIAELFQDAPAPMGHFVRDPFDTTRAVMPTASATYKNVTDMAFTTSVSGGGAKTLRLHVVAHGLVVSDTLSFYSGPTSNWIDYNTFEGLSGVKVLSSTYTVTNVPDADHIDITVTLISTCDTITAYPPSSRIYATSQTIANIDGETSPVRPSTVAFFAGRVWYAGTNFSKLDGKIFFSQIIESDNQYGKAYQVADPTDTNISDLLPTDGGTINIPEMAQVYKIVPYSSSLLVFAANGVWQIGPGSAGYFTADSYSIRKLSGDGTDGPGSVIVCESVVLFWGKSSIYVVTLDQTQGFLVVQSITTGVLDSLFNRIELDSKRFVQSTYDPVLKQIMWMYTDNASDGFQYDVILIYDLKHGAFIKYRIATAPNNVCTLFCLKNPSSSSPQNNIKVIAYDGNNSCYVGGFTSSAFLDWDVEDYTSYILTGYDTAQSPVRFKYAPLIHVFTKKTETGYIDHGLGDYEAVRPGSLSMQARWDWADHTNSGKWGTAQECYRHRRLYTPASALDTFDDGAPIIVSRNKVRGRGRSLHLRFTSSLGKDAWILGWNTAFDALSDP